MAGLGQQYEIVDEPPEHGNDMNDDLLWQIELAQRKELDSR